ncbi:CRISPR-associated protein Cas1 [Halorhodospira halochloris]|uniref:CRISPR-associated protein Cas1 n=2 Tax=Halorhodospira halochloris TaxID=1052 RepID=A0A0X8XB28_HALHR|nr:CRISPR-associated protein Cas1 [Halorhodospira halochloris]
MRSESHGDSTRRLGQYELATTQPNDPVWAIKLIRLRLASQHRLLHQALIHRPEQRQPIFCALEEIDRMRSHLRHSSQSLTLEQSRGYEGSATAAFFRGYTSLFPESLGFKSRNRRPPRDPVNAILSLGYALAHGDALRATMASGLDPAIGFLHQPAWGRDSLACDLTEIARSRVEQLTWHLFANRSLRAGDFSTDSDGEGVRLRKSARCNFFACWEAHAKLHRRWQKRAANTIASHCLHLGKSLNPGNSEYD